MSCNFQYDNKRGRKYQRKIADMFRSQGYFVYEVPDKVNESSMDLLIIKDNQKTTVEVKADFRYQETGNIAIEYAKNDIYDTPSGVRAGNMEHYIIYAIPIKDEKSFKYFTCKKNKLYDEGKTKHIKDTTSWEGSSKIYVTPLKCIDVNVKECDF